MIDDLTPYPKYRESGSRWLANVPSHWEVRNLRTLIRPRNEHNRADLPLLSVAREKGVFVRSLTNDSENHNVIPEDLSNYKVARAGSLVINKMKAWQGSMGIAPCNGIVSPAYFVFDFSIANRAFGQALLRSKPYVAHFGQASDGVRVGQWDLTIAGMRQIPVLVPPPAEQAAIVRFLNWANGRLERAIRAKRKVIALLNEQKQAIIHRAVTRGLDGSVPLKPSGIPWLGDIPKHWEVVALGRLCTARCDGPFGSGLKSMHYTDSGVRVIRLQNIGDGDFRDRDEAFISEKHYATLGDHGVREGDLLVAGLGDRKVPAGRACIAPPLLGPAMVKADCFRFRLIRGRTVPTFLSKHLSATATGATACLSTGATRLRINLSATAARSVTLPPDEEQHNIIDFIGKATEPLHTAISRLNREIELLREYRTRLVADVVTGKLDVREATAQLPEEAPFDMAEDYTDLSDEIEGAAEEASV
jgi:type I restriction enzyme S subunit